MLNAGEKENIIPGVAKARFDMRLIPEEDKASAIEELKNFLEEMKKRTGVDAELTILGEGGNYCTDLDHWIVKDFLRVAKSVYGTELYVAAELGGNDGRYTSAKGIPTITFGPIRKDTSFHGVDEFVYLRDLELLRETLVRFIARG